MKTLNYFELGEKEKSTVIILHGLFGEGANWGSHGKMIADEGFHVVIPDMRNHGNSFWSPENNYAVMCDDIKQLLDTLGKVNVKIIGHSMGGKIAMTFAMKYPQFLNSCMIVDMSLREFSTKQHFAILTALENINLEKITFRKEAEEMLFSTLNDRTLSLFLLKNLEKKNSGEFQWKLNIQSLKQNIQNIGGPILLKEKINNKAIFVRGGNSNYVMEEDVKNIMEFFPNATIKTIQNAGHWLHAEKPVDFQKEVKLFL